EFFFREAINVDKVLRLPVEKKISSIETQFSQNNEIKIELPELKETKNYPEGIFILGVKLKFKNNTQEVCVKELTIE
ncbi:MAG: hypothetical protein SFU98_02870, partial [Leptospiraceae bacterium]|nr:hypothetical protein [Leptospiraceae bacterium]